MKCSPHWTALFVSSLLAAPPIACFGIVPPQIDDFQGGTTQNWTNGDLGPPFVANVANGGPNGAGDRFLQVTSTGTGTAGSRLITFNATQWTGNYNAAGTTGIAMDLKYIDPTSTIEPIRIAIFDPLTFTGYASTDSVSGGAFALPNDGQWHHYVFSLTTNTMTAIGAPPPLSTELSSVPELRILSSSIPSTSGDKIGATLGIDNITAVPEPAGFVVMGIGTVGLVYWRRRGTWRGL
jgi:hypothetical protein